MIEKRPYKVIESDCRKYYCEGPYQTGKNWDLLSDAEEECSTLNIVFQSGFNLNIEKQELEKLKTELKEAKEDIANAYGCAVEYVPNYPWDPNIKTASISVWACGEAYIGVSKACEDWRKLFEHLAPDAYKALLNIAEEHSERYNDLMKVIQKEKT